jgi:hypothetical protein
MVILLTFLVGGRRKSGELDGVVGVALPQPTPPTYLACRPEKTDEMGEMALSKSAVRGGVEISGRSRWEVTKSSRLLFLLRAGARTISMATPARADVDTFCLSGAME